MDNIFGDDIMGLKFDRNAFYEHLGVNQKVAGHFFEAFAQHMYHFHKRDKSKIGMAINEISYHAFLHCLSSYALECNSSLSTLLYRIVDIWAHSVYDGSVKNEEYNIGNGDVAKILRDKRLVSENYVYEAYTDKGYHIYDVLPERKKCIIRVSIGSGYTFTEKNTAPDYEIDDQNRKCYITYYDMVEIFEGMAYISISKFFQLNKKLLEDNSTTKKSQQRIAVDRKIMKTLIDQIYRYLDKGEIIENGKNDVFPEDERMTLPELQYWIKLQFPNVFDAFEGFIKDKLLNICNIDSKIKIPENIELEKDEILPIGSSPFIDTPTLERTIPQYSEKSRVSKILNFYQTWLLSNILPSEFSETEKQAEIEDEEKNRQLFGSLIAISKNNGNPKELSQCSWYVLYASSIDGFSLFSFETNIFYYSGPTVLLINARPIPSECSGTHIIPKQNIILGAYIPERWRETKTFFGSDESFFFELSPYFEVYNSILINDNYIHYNPLHGICIGGIGEYSRLSIDKSLRFGVYQHHPTMNLKESFTPSMTRGSSTKEWKISFEVLDMEVIGLEGYVENKALG